MPLGSAEFSKAYIALYHAIVANEGDKISLILKDISTADRYKIYQCKSSLCESTLTVLAGMQHSSVNTALYKNFPDFEMNEVLKVRSRDGNTTITKIILADKHESLAAIFKGRSLSFIRKLLEHTNKQGRMAKDLADANSQCKKLIHDTLGQPKGQNASEKPPQKTIKTEKNSRKIRQVAPKKIQSTPKAQEKKSQLATAAKLIGVATPIVEAKPVKTKALLSTVVDIAEAAVSVKTKDYTPIKNKGKNVRSELEALKAEGMSFVNQGGDRKVEDVITYSRTPRGQGLK